ncbi:MAG: type II secretion system secretin GspD [gamma proteobacterium endosymbiont of Lamellibrachia anaximandri]|nr:type II secretion system secretin GspD [gamma proteobacterium endosymbiont of Lamellibrachia anaximandri]
MITNNIRKLGWIVTLTFVVACAPVTKKSVKQPEPRPVESTVMPVVLPEDQTANLQYPGDEQEPVYATITGDDRESLENKAPFMKLGSGRFINVPAKKKQAVKPSGEITLNFESVDIREVIKIIFEEILQENYLIDKNVQGVVTMHTETPVAVDSVLAILESVLHSNGAGLVLNNGIYKIVALSDIKKQLSVPSVGKRGKSISAGFGTQIVPLQYVAAKEIRKILEPMIPEGLSLSIDEARNLLFISGIRSQINQALETIKLFDVDWLKGMSFGLFPLEYADSATIVDELNKLIGSSGDGPLSGIVRLVPIERLNSIMVITHQPKYLEEARRLVEQFDRGTVTSPGQRLYVYHLKHGKAEEIAGLLQEIFGGAGSSGSDSGAGKDVPPPQERSNVRSPSQSAVPPKGGTKETLSTGSASMTAGKEEGGTRGGGGQGAVNIIPDQNRNAILILASARDYRAVEATIRKLDVQPMQVLIEATIAEVALTDNLSYGVRWFLQGNIGDHTIQSGLNLPLPGSVSGPGLALGILNSADELRVFFDLLNAQSSVEFLSAPQIMVVDNKTANFRVGDQIPITTRSSQSTTNPDAPIVTEVQFRDTGTLLSVTPRVNVGGMVTLEINQEVSVPGTSPALGGGGNVPISQRTIDSTVVVHSGQTVVLGGMITQSTSNSQDGIPILMDLPGVGKFFSSTTEDVTRTELIITITPRVITNPMQAKAVTDRLRKRLKDASALERSIQELSARPALPNETPTVKSAQ